MGIVVIGVGGAGCHVVDGLSERLGGAAVTVAVDSDWAAVRQCRADRKVELDGIPFSGLGAGGKAGWAARNAEACADKLRAAIDGPDLVLIVAGLGGGSGAGASPVVARLAREAGALAVGLVTIPVSFEGARRARLADEAIGPLRAECDALVLVPCQGVLEVVGGKVSIASFYASVDEVQRGDYSVA